MSGACVPGAWCLASGVWCGQRGVDREASLGNAQKGLAGGGGGGGGRSGPGPGAYESCSTLGHTPCVAKQMPCFGFGTSTRNHQRAPGGV
jgi:hypothetical protein